MRVISLFAGIGGFDLGFAREGFEIVAHVEKEPTCRKVLHDKWPNAVFLDDVCAAGIRNLPDCDIITFGFPCQDLSVAGKRKGLQGERSGLFFEAMRVIGELRPMYCLFENVPGLLNSNSGHDFATVLDTMAEYGYYGAWRVLDSQWFGVAQQRRRVFGLFARGDIGAGRCAKILSIAESLRGGAPPSRRIGKNVAARATGGAPVGRVVARTITGNNARGGIPLSNELDGALIPYKIGQRGARRCEVSGTVLCKGANGPVQTQEAVAVLCLAHGQSNAEHEAPISFLPGQSAQSRSLGETVDCAVTIKSGGGGNKAHVAYNSAVRRLTPTECLVLQGFPADWLEGYGLADAHKYKQVGNAVTVNVSQWLARKIKENTCEL